MCKWRPSWGHVRGARLTGARAGSCPNIPHLGVTPTSELEEDSVTKTSRVSGCNVGDIYSCSNSHPRGLNLSTVGPQQVVKHVEGEQKWLSCRVTPSN